MAFIVIYVSTYVVKGSCSTTSASRFISTCKWGDACRPAYN